MNISSLIFANKLKKAWKYESSKVNFSEVQQFRALMKSFNSLDNDFRVEEFHGMKHQVVFNGEGSWGRASARCEISDLLIITYRKSPEFTARATLLQAKRSTDKHSNLCIDASNFIPKTNFKANLEQWDLLSRRPHVIPHPPFNCHPEILSGAILPSIGSLGVFHKISHKNYDFFYMSADATEPLNSPTGKFAKLKTKTLKHYRNVNGYTECTYAGCLPVFAMELYDLKIGTPIDPDNTIHSQDKSYRNIFRGWLRTVLISHLRISESNSPLANDLIEQLESDYDGRIMSQPPSVLVLNCDER